MFEVFTTLITFWGLNTFVSSKKVPQMSNGSQHQHPDIGFTQSLNRILHLILHQVLPRSNVSCNALQAFNLKLFYHHHQHDYGLASQLLFTSLRKPLFQKNWTFFRSFIGDMTNSPLKKANLSNIKDINPFQCSNYPLEQNTPSLAATFHQWLMVWSIMRTEVLSSMVSKTRIDRWLNAEQVPARASCH